MVTTRETTTLGPSARAQQLACNIPDWKGKQPHAQNSGEWRTNRFFVAVLLFAAINCLCGWTKFGSLSPSDFSCITWTSAAIEDFLSSKQGRPNLVFLGSSLLLVPLGGVDADYLQHSFPLPHHHHCLYFEKQYQALSGKPISTFDFALPGEMPSDAFLITKFLLKDDKVPDVIVYGVGPRDFLDNTLPNPGATDPYQYLSRFGDISDHIDLIAPGWQERFNYELGKVAYTYGHKGDLSFSADRFLSSILNVVLPPVTTKASTQLRRSVMPGYKPFEVGVDDCVWEPTTPTTRAKFNDNTAEYEKRYRLLNWDTFTAQMAFLSDLMSTARERKIQVVLVAMPITTRNRNLLSDSTWDAYRHSLRVLARAKGAAFLDLQASPVFNDKDFGDTVHLHSGGGLKALNLVAETLAHNERVQTALRPKPLEQFMPAQNEHNLVAGAKEHHL